MTMPDLNVVIFPGFGIPVPVESRGCPDFGYENNDDGRLLMISEIMERPNCPTDAVMNLNDVCRAFQAVVAAAQTNLSSKPNHA